MRSSERCCPCHECGAGHRLRIVPPDHVLPSADLFVYRLHRRNQSAHARAFIDFPAERFRSAVAPVTCSLRSPALDVTDRPAAGSECAGDVDGSSPVT